jgi:hypothetical protein
MSGVSSIAGDNTCTEKVSTAYRPSKLVILKKKKLGRSWSADNSGHAMELDRYLHVLDH